MLVAFLMIIMIMFDPPEELLVEDSSLSLLSTTSHQSRSVTLSDYFAQSPDQTQAVFLLAKSKAKQHDTLCSREPCSYTTLLKEKNLLDYFLHNFPFFILLQTYTHSTILFYKSVQKKY